MDYYKLKVLNNKKICILSLIILLIIGVTIYYFYYYSNKEDEIVLNNNESSIEKENIANDVLDNLIFVDIKGYVAKPGVYSFNHSDNARVNDLILKAGGLKKEADTSIINLSKKLEDEMTIIIYSKKEVDDFLNVNNIMKQKLEICENKLKNSVCICNQEEKNDNNFQININTATKEELMSLPGIGEAKADAIIKYRSEIRFNEIDDTKNVEGIGENLFESIQKSIKV